MEFLESFKEYSLANDEFNVVNIAGSFADNINKERFDSFSDVDLFIVTENKDYYLKTVKWLSFYDKDLIFFNDPISMGVGNELRIGFSDGIFSDIAIVNNEEFCKLKENEIFCKKIIDRGFKTIKNDYGDNYLLHKKFKENSISEYELNRLADEYWIDIANICKYMSRNDFFSAKFAFDRRITKIIIKVVEIYMKSRNNLVDTMFNGRRMDTWVDKEILEEIYKIESSFDKDKMINTIIMANNFFQKMMENIFNFYNYKQDLNRKNVIKIIQERIDKLG